MTAADDIDVRVGSRDAAAGSDAEAVVALARRTLGSEHQVHSRRQFTVLDAELLVATRAGAVVGFLAWEVDGDWCEVLAIGTTTARAGVGTALMTAVEDAARERGCRRVRVVTTDANVGAQRFYESLGYTLAEVVVGGVDECRRRYKPDIPATMHDELRYERPL